MTISYSEVTDSQRPRRAIELTWDASPGGSRSGFRDIYIMAEIEAGGAGTMVAGDVTGPYADADAGVAAFGEGSVGAYMVRNVFRGGGLKIADVYGVGCAESAGLQATAICTIANAATSNGTVTMNIGGAVFSFTVTSGDAVADIDDKLVNAFNALDAERKIPATVAVAPAGTCTWTMNHKGANSLTCPCYQIVTGDEPTGTTFTWTNGSFAVGTLYPTLTVPLAAIASVETPIIVHPWGNNKVTVALTEIPYLIKTHLNTKGNAENMLHGCQVCAITDTVAEIAGATKYIDYLDDDDAERCRIIATPVAAHATNCDGSWDVATACWVANALGSQTDIVRPFDGVALPYKVAPELKSDILTDTEIDTLLEAGATPVHFDSKRGRNVIVRGITARVFAGAKLQDWGIVDGIDWLRMKIDEALEAAFPNFKLAQDGETNLDQYTTTPDGVLDVIYGVMKGPDMVGILRNVDDLWSSAVAEINASFSGRVDWQIDAAVMDALHILAGKIRQRGGVI